MLILGVAASLKGCPFDWNLFVGIAFGTLVYMIGDFYLDSVNNRKDYWIISGLILAASMCGTLYGFLL
jgi:hypothetical protein